MCHEARRRSCAAGAIEGAVGNALFEAPYAVMRNELGDDYTMTDSLANIAMGGAFGMASHNVFGGIGDFYRWGRGLPQPWANAADGMAGRVGRSDFADKAMYGDFPRPVDTQTSIADAVALAVGRQAQAPAQRPDFAINRADVDALPDVSGLRLRGVEDFDAPEVRKMIKAWTKAMPEDAGAGRKVARGVTEVRFGRGVVDDAGNLLPAGATRLRNAILGKVFGDKASIRRTSFHAYQERGNSHCKDGSGIDASASGH